MYKIVEATRDDQDEILALYKSQIGSDFSSWDEHYPTMNEINYDLSRRALFVMKDDEGKIIATVSIDKDPEVEKLTCWDVKLAPGGELSRLSVRPEYKNQGIARQMLLYGMERLAERGYKSIHFLVAKSNLAALKSYEKLNFTNVGETFLFGVDFWCFEKEL